MRSGDVCIEWLAAPQDSIILMAGADSFYDPATVHNARQSNVIGVMQLDAISDDFI